MQKVGSQYFRKLQDSTDSNVHSSGSYHLILQSSDPTAPYVRLGLIHVKGGKDPSEAKDFVRQKRVAWSRALQESDFSVKTSEQQFYEFGDKDLNTLRSTFRSKMDKCEGLLEYLQKMEARGTLLGLYGELVEKARSDFHQYLQELDLSKALGRKLLYKSLVALRRQIRSYVEFCKKHLAEEGWASFTFDLKAKNVLVGFSGAPGGTDLRLADLDAEARNSFARPATMTTRGARGMAQVFGRTDTESLSVAAFLLFLSNSIHKLRHAPPNTHDEKAVPGASAHMHLDCLEHNIASFVHFHVFEQWTKAGNLEKKVTALFHLMTETEFWDHSTSEMAYYLELPKGSPGTAASWFLSTAQKPSPAEGRLPALQKSFLNRRRWLLLFFLNIFKCSICEKPPRWFVVDLAEPLLSKLHTQKSRLKFHLREDYLSNAHEAPPGRASSRSDTIFLQ